MDEETNLVSLESKVKFKKAVFFGVLALVLSIVGIILDIIQYGLELAWMNKATGFFQTIGMYIIFGIIGTALFIGFIVLFFIYLTKLYKESTDFSNNYKRILILAIVFFGVYLLIDFIIWPTILSSFYVLWVIEGWNYGLVVGSNAFIRIILLSIFTITITYPISPAASIRERKILIFTGVVYIAGMVPLHELAIQSQQDPRTFLILSLVLYLPLLLGVHLAFLYAYFSVWRSLPDRDIEKKWHVDITRSGKKAWKVTRKYIEFIGPNPYRALIPIVVIALLYSLFVGFTTDDPLADSRDLDYNDIMDIMGDLGDIPQEDVTALTDELQEGDETTYIIETNGSVLSAYATLTWSDEPDLFRRDNQGDTFELEVQGGGVEDSASGTNDHGEEIQIESSIHDVGEVDGITITVRLVNAGDQKMRNGPGLIVWTDDSNDFDLYVAVIYTETTESQ